MGIFFTADWHLDHARILTYCRRLDFMSDNERSLFLDLEEKHKNGEIPYSDIKHLKYSPETVERMNNGIIDGINETVRRGDRLIVAGDIIFGRGDKLALVRRLNELRQKIDCRDIQIVWGNHDKDLRKIMRSNEQFYRGLLDEIFGHLSIPPAVLDKWHRHKDRTRERRILQSLFSQFHDVDVVRWNGQKIIVTHTAHAVWDGNGRGVWHLYGHSHGNFERWRMKHMPNAKCFDIGVDNRAQLGYGYTPWSFDEIKEIMHSRDGEFVDHHKYHDEKRRTD
jgi:calcineurin-like phosphoesterase family protein